MTTYTFRNRTAAKQFHIGIMSTPACMAGIRTLRYHVVHDCKVQVAVTVDRDFDENYTSLLKEDLSAKATAAAKSVGTTVEIDEDE